MMETSLLPLVTVVTVSYNDCSRLEKTIKNVISQDYKWLEYIIIDGGSNDGSVDVLKKYSDRISFFVSEPDENDFDAMNKGIKKALGEWIVFMNAGDVFYENTTVKKVMAGAPPEADLVYGDTEVEYRNGFSRISKVKQFNGGLWKGLPFVHQSLFVKLALLNQHPFDLNYERCADFEFCYWAFQNGCGFHQLDEILSRVEAGGASDRKRVQAANDIRRILKKYHHSFLIDLRFLLTIVNSVIVMTFKKILPRELTKRLTILKYELIN